MRDRMVYQFDTIDGPIWLVDQDVTEEENVKTN